MGITDKKTAAIILSGGAGTRVSGADKGLQLYQGRALISHVITIIEPQVDEVHLCANRNLERYRRFGFPVHIDDAADYQGPMSGISSALNHYFLDSDIQQVLISSCDVPHLPANLLEKLELGLNQNSLIFDVSIAHDGARRQNLHCLIKRSAWQSLIDFFDRGGRAMHRWLADANATDVDFSADKHCFVNINTSQRLDSQTQPQLN